MSKEYNVPHYIIKAFGRKYKLKTGTAGTQTCRQCREEPSMEDRHTCRKCSNINHIKNENIKLKKDPIKFRLYNIFYGIKKRSGPELDFDWRFLIDLYNKQNGKCYYSGRYLIATNEIGAKIDLDSISVDRRDNDRGYTKDNIVLCSWWVNSFKINLNIKDFYSRCKQIADHMESISETT